jgi:acetyltransferase-like isoleucine patch superfamily enzyme
MFRFLKNCFLYTVDHLRRLYRSGVNQSANPTCNIHYTSSITATKLGKYNVVFANVILNNATIDSHTYIQKRTTIFNARIGKFCSIASDVTIAPGIHYLNGVSTHPAFYLKNTPLAVTFSPEDKFRQGEQVNIGHDVWIGQHAVILDGIEIGTGAIVAAGAVVTKNVAAYSIVGGIPAKEIRKRFNEETCQRLLASAWWERPDEYFKAHYSDFSDPAIFLEHEKNDKA